MKYLIITILAALTIIGAASCSPDKTPAPEVVVAPAPAVELAPAGSAAVTPPAPVVAKVASVVVKAAKPARAHARSTSAAERAAYDQAYLNAAIANQLLGRHAYRTSFHDGTLTA